MTISEMLGQSGLLTLLGMCVVFSFIIILILSMKLLQVVVHAFKLDKDVGKVQKKVSAAPAGAASSKPAVDQKSIVAAIAAVIHEKESV